MQQQWNTSSIQAINVSQGGAQEQTWLSKIDSIMLEMSHIILVEPAVNDQCNYKDQEKKANTTDINFI